MDVHFTVILKVAYATGTRDCRVGVQSVNLRWCGKAGEPKFEFMKQQYSNEERNLKDMHANEVESPY